MRDKDPLKDILLKSMELSKVGRQEEAFALLDESLSEAVRENRLMWIPILCRHAAVISDSIGNLQRTKHYYEQSLGFDPHDVGSLYGLANALQRQGETQLAKQYASKCFQSIQHSEKELDRAVLELILKSWPEFRRSDGRVEHP